MVMLRVRDCTPPSLNFRLHCFFPKKKKKKKNIYVNDEKIFLIPRRHIVTLTNDVNIRTTQTIDRSDRWPARSIRYKKAQDQAQDY